MKRLSILAIASVVACAFLTLFAVSSNANPNGVINVGKKLFQFNVIAKPGGWDPTVQQACNGARIFFAEGNAGANGTMGEIFWNLDPNVTGFEITDCNATDGNATVTADELINFAFFIRVQGPVTSELNLVCTVLTVTPDAGNLCLVGGVQKFSKGNSFTKIGFNLADGIFEQVLWTFSGDWKIFDVRLYQILP